MKVNRKPTGFGGRFLTGFRNIQNNTALVQALVAATWLNFQGNDFA